LQLRSHAFLEYGNTDSIPVRDFCISFYIGHIGVIQQIEPTCRDTTEYLLISISLQFLSFHLPFNVHCTYTEHVGLNIRGFSVYSFGLDVILTEALCGFTQHLYAIIVTILQILSLPLPSL